MIINLFTIVIVQLPYGNNMYTNMREHHKYIKTLVHMALNVVHADMYVCCLKVDSGVINMYKKYPV